MGCDALRVGDDAGLDVEYRREEAPPDRVLLGGAFRIPNGSSHTFAKRALPRSHRLEHVVGGHGFIPTGHRSVRHLCAALRREVGSNRAVDGVADVSMNHVGFLHPWTE